VEGGQTYYINVTEYVYNAGSNTYYYNGAPYRLQTSFTGSEASDAGEPNDTQGQAYTIDPTVSLDATIGYGSDADDWYAVTFTENGTFTYTVNNTNTSGLSNGRIGDIRLTNSSSQNITTINMDYSPSNDYIDPAASSTRLAAVEGGATYYLHINQYSTNNSAPYSLTGSFAASNADVGEPNNLSGQAYEITDPANFTAAIGLGDDGEDWYQLTFSGNGTFNFTVTNLNGSSVANGDMGTATFYNASLTEVTSITSSYLEAGENRTSSTVPVEGGQTYYINVTEYVYNAGSNTYYYNGAPYGLQPNPSGTELVDTATPAIPQNFSATAGTGQVTLNWSPNIEQDMANYKIYRDTSLPVNTFFTSVPFGTEIYIDSDVTNDIEYYYSITSIDQVGHESDLSESVSAIPSVPPSITITTETTSPTNLSPVPFTVQFSEDVTGFTEEDVVAQNSAVSNLSGSGSTYTFDVVPIADGEVTVEVPAGAAADWTGMGNTASETITFIYDNSPPVVTISEISEQGTMDTLVLEWQADDISEIVEQNIYLSMDGENYDELESLSGSISTYEWYVPNVVSPQNGFIIQAIDELGLASNDTSNTFAIVDDKPPEINVLSPITGYAIPEYETVTVTWEATDNIEMDSVQVYFSNDETTFIYQGIVDSDLSEFTFSIPFGVTDNAQVKLIALDIYGNEGEGFSAFFSVTDNTPPTVEMDTPGTLSIGTDVELSWTAEDNTGFRSHYLYFSSATGQEYSFVDSVNGSNTTYSWTVPNIVTETAMFSILSYDLVGLTDTDTTEVFTIIDEIPPEVTVLTPTTDSSIPEYEALTVTWEATDNIEMDSVQVYFSNDETTFIYQGIVDSDLSEFTFSIPFGVTDNAQVKLIALDIYGNEGEGFSAFFSVTDNTPPTVNLTAPATESVVGIGDLLAIMWNDSDNVGVETVSLFYNTDGTWTTIAGNIANVNEYDWIVPDEPTDNLQIRLVGYDAVGLSDTSEVDNIEVQIAYPTVVSASPVNGLIDWDVREFEFKLSQPLDESTVTTDNIQITSSYSSSLTPTIAYVVTSSTIEIVYETSLAALDTITITLSDQITNVYGYALDGDNDGTGGDSYTVQYNTPMLGDYNNDFQINVDDLAQFMIGFENDSTAYELGPFSGEIPHVFVSLDQKYDIEDVMAFGMMWNWYVTNNTLVFTNYEDMGMPISINTEHDSIYLDIPQDLSAYQVQIQYTPGSFFIGQSKKKDELFLTHEEKELGVYTIMAQPGQSKLIIPIEIRGRDANISISYKGITASGELAGQMTRSMTIENIPDEFVLFSNYPNPFNPTTKIDYGLPEASNVQLIIYDILGREVTTLVNGVQEPGYKSITWHGTNAFGKNVGAGVYFYLIQAGEFRKVRKMVLLK
jgi:hypothetical protein